MTIEEREGVRKSAHDNALAIIAKARREKWIDAAKKLREEANQLDEWESLNKLAEASKMELYADMLRDPCHGMWEAIAIEAIRKKEREERGSKTPKTRPPFKWDTTLGYKGRDCKTQIHAGTARYAKLTFK